MVVLQPYEVARNLAQALVPTAQALVTLRGMPPGDVGTHERIAYTVQATACRMRIDTMTRHGSELERLVLTNGALASDAVVHTLQDYHAMQRTLCATTDMVGDETAAALAELCRFQSSLHAIADSDLVTMRARVPECFGFVWQATKSDLYRNSYFLQDQLDRAIAQFNRKTERHIRTYAMRNRLQCTDADVESVTLRPPVWQSLDDQFPALVRVTSAVRDPRTHR